MKSLLRLSESVRGVTRSATDDAVKEDEEAPKELDDCIMKGLHRWCLDVSEWDNLLPEQVPGMYSCGTHLLSNSEWESVVSQ